MGSGLQGSHEKSWQQDPCLEPGHKPVLAPHPLAHGDLSVVMAPESPPRVTFLRRALPELPQRATWPAQSLSPVLLHRLSLTAQPVLSCVFTTLVLGRW